MDTETKSYVKKDGNQYIVHISLNKGNELKFNSENIKFNYLTSIFDDENKSDEDKSDEDKSDYKITVNRVGNNLQIDTKDIENLK